ncbi:CopD family protein [Frigidibacter sp. MR17.14]|uniref:CopD family protein n=1 Tax=Frigidibacter sp. MR17.14 TaxID=3126509 RepID=UPI003012EB09
MRPMVAAHVLAGALWLGALLPLLRGGPSALARFSARIPLVLALLIASGIALIVVQLAGPRPALTTAYGQVLMAKLGLVAGLLLLALYNRLRLAPRAEAGDAAPLARAIRAEIVLGLMIVGTLSLWRFTPPPRSLPPPPTEVSVPFAAGPLSLTVTLGADRPGPVPLRLSDLRLDGRPFTPREIEVALSKPAYGLGPFRRSLHPTGPQADAGTFLLPIDGVWLLELQVLVNDFRRERVLDLVTIDPAAAP